MLFGILISYLALVLQAASLEEFLIEKSYLLAIACGDSNFIKSLSTALSTEICDQRQYYDDLKCTRLQIQSDEASYTLELYKNESDLVGRYRCKYLDGSASDSVQYPFRIYGASQFRFRMSKASNFMELFDERNYRTLKRRLQGTCDANLKFNTLTTYNYLAYLAVLDSCDPNASNCGLTAYNYSNLSVPFIYDAVAKTISASFTATDLLSKTFAIIKIINGAKHVTYNNANMTPPIFETAYRYYNTRYWGDFSWTVEGFIISPLNGVIQIGVLADDRTDLYLFGSTTPTISGTWPNIVYKSFSVTLGQVIPFFTNNYNTHMGAGVTLYYKGPDNIQKEYTVTYYFSGITSNSPWTIQDYMPVFTNSAELSFREIVYTNCDRIYSDLATKNKSWPTLCSTHLVNSTMKRCQTCVSNASPIGYSCKCNYGYYEKVSTNSCISTNPILVSIASAENITVDALILVISNPCTLDDGSYCKETGQYRYLTKPRHTIFTSNNINSNLSAEDYIDPDGTYTIFINTLKSGGMQIKCFSNTLFTGTPFYDAINSTINYSFLGPEYYDKPTSCVIYGYYIVGLSNYHTFYIQGSDTVTTYINDSRITTHNTVAAEVSYTEYYEAAAYIPIKVDIINTSQSSDISFEVDIGSGRLKISSASLFSPTRALGKLWSISPTNRSLYIDNNIIENNIQYCHEICASCNLNLDGTYICLTCIENAILIEPICACIRQYYYDSVERYCKKCPVGCSECLDAFNCISCEDRYYLDSSSNVCLPCGNNCSFCSDNICLECDEPFIPKDGECICDDGYVLSSDSSKCTQLKFGCVEYVNSDYLLCKTCKEGLILEDNECRCDIGRYYDIITESCLGCPQNCEECSLSSGMVECISCYEGFLLVNSSCICNGELYYDEDLNRCLPYLTICEEYHIENEELLCTTCKMNAEEYQGKCTCIEGYYLDTEAYICKDCISICSTCNTEENEACNECNSVCIDEETSGDDSDQSEEENDESSIYSNSTYEYRQAKQVGKRVSMVSSTVSSSAVAFGFITFNLDKAWSLLNLMETYSIISLLQVDLPPILNESLKSQGGMSFIPDIMTYFFDYEYQGPKVYSKAYDYKYKTPLLILNLGKSLFTFIVLIAVNIILYIGTKLFKGKAQKVCASGLGYFRWKVYIRFYIQVYLDLSILSILNLIYVRYT